MSQWRVADLTGFRGELRAGRGRLVAGESEIVLAETSCVLIGHEVVLAAGVPGLAARFGVPLVSCDWRGKPVALTSGWSGNSRVGARHRAQASLSTPRQKNAWMQIVRSKIRGQANNLAYRDPATATRLIGCAKRTRSGDPENTEAQAARMYWSRMFDHPAFTRVPGGGQGANSLLDYGYAIVRGHVVQAIVAAGLVPALGLHHKNRSNANALADDLIEPFRPAVDWIVRQLPEDAWLTDPGIKAALVGILRVPMNCDGRTVQTEVSSLAQHLGQYVELELQHLPVPVWEPPEDG